MQGKARRAQQTHVTTRIALLLLAICMVIVTGTFPALPRWLLEANWCSWGGVGACGMRHDRCSAIHLVVATYVDTFRRDMKILVL